jgi:hypothetical protein
MEKNKGGKVMQRNWAENRTRFENFLRDIDLEKYSALRDIKTVEQDLPAELLPLEIYYRYYWDNPDFRDYEDLFQIYWDEKIRHIHDFMRKFFYGCSLQFVEEGFKARLYRIWMSILTQFQFQYLWNALFNEKLESDWELDALGIDAKVELNGKDIGVQVKKISYRREASQRRFTKRQQKQVDIIVEVPYIVIDLDELRRKLQSRRTWESTKERCRRILEIFNENFAKYDNGFVVFSDNYLRDIYDKIGRKTSELETGKITYDEILTW